MRTDIAFDKLVKIAPIVNELRPKLKSDEKLKTFLESYRKRKSEEGNGDEPDNIDFVMNIIPFLFGDYKQYTFDVLSIIGDKTVDEIKEQPFNVTMNQIKEIVSNGDLTSFF